MELKPTAAIWAEQKQAPLGDARPDPIQFAKIFGQQPRATCHADVHPGGSKRKIAIIGAGDVTKAFIYPTFAQRGTQVYIFDPFKENAAAEAAEFGIEAHQVKDLSQLPDDIDGVYILTPPTIHRANIEQAFKLGVPVALEKPLAAGAEDTKAILQMAEKAHVPVYCIDWEVMHALPLLHAAGLHVPFADALKTKNADAFKQFDLRRVTKIESRFLEAGDPSAGDWGARKWLLDYTRGGGMLYDTGTHALNPLAVLGFKVNGIDDVKLGEQTKERGVYRRFGKGEDGIGETYAHADLRMGIEGGNQQVETQIEVGKFAKLQGATEAGSITLTDDRGYQLHWNMFHDKHTSRVELRDPHGSILASSEMNANTYSLMAEEFMRQGDAFCKGGAPTALYLPEHAHVIEAIDAMHQHARANVVPKGELVQQLTGTSRAAQVTAAREPALVVARA